jgi:hypothetical protein
VTRSAESARVSTPGATPDVPALAHIGWIEPTPQSLCGARIVGVPAGPGARVCSRCLDLDRVRRLDATS